MTEPPLALAVPAAHEVEPIIGRRQRPATECP